jgi:hypothetical protein
MREAASASVASSSRREPCIVGAARCDPPRQLEVGALAHRPTRAPRRTIAIHAHSSPEHSATRGP